MVDFFTEEKKHTFLDFRMGAEKPEGFLGFFEKRIGMEE